MQRTREALSRKKSEGMKLGLPRALRIKETKLTGKEDNIRKLGFDKKVAVSAIARILGLNRLAVKNLSKPENWDR